MTRGNKTKKQQYLTLIVSHTLHDIITNNTVVVILMLSLPETDNIFATVLPRMTQKLCCAVGATTQKKTKQQQQQQPVLAVSGTFRVQTHLFSSCD